VGRRFAATQRFAALVAETETAIVAADENAKLEQERVFDPLASPDPKAAREAMQAAEFMQTWLRSALLRLQRRLRETQERERRAKWYAEYEALKSKRDALAAEFREVYTEFEARVVDLVIRMTANNAEISNLHLARSSGVKLHLLEAELVARSLESFTREASGIGAKASMTRRRRSATRYHRTSSFTRCRPKLQLRFSEVARQFVTSGQRVLALFSDINQQQMVEGSVCIGLRASCRVCARPAKWRA
jgi:hypothetical protein